MPITIDIKLNDTANGTGKASLKVEDKNIIKSIFPNFNEKKGLSSTQFNQLVEIANFSGTDALEHCDISNGKNRLMKDIKIGNASYSPKWLGFIGGNTIYVNVPKGTTMWEIKKMYNLPDGSLNDYCKNAGCSGGDKDRFATPTGQAWFSIEAFANGNKMTKEDAEALFNN